MELTKDNLTISELKEKLGISSFGEQKIIVHAPTYEFMTEEEMEKHYNYCRREAPNINRYHGISFSVERYGLLEILEIPDVKYANLISAFHHARLSSEADDSYTTIWLEESYIPDRYKIDNEKDFQIIISDYMSPHIKITIPPMEFHYSHGKKLSKSFTVGYLLWQSTKILKDVFLYQKENYKVEMRHFSGELAFAELHLWETNFGSIGFDS